MGMATAPHWPLRNYQKITKKIKKKIRPLRDLNPGRLKIYFRTAALTTGPPRQGLFGRKICLFIHLVILNHSSADNSYFEKNPVSNFENFINAKCRNTPVEFAHVHTDRTRNETMVISIVPGPIRSIRA